MSTFAHGMKKRLSMATVRSKKIEGSISADYLTAKKRIQREKKALHDTLKMLDGVSSNWEKVAEDQKAFAELIETEAAIDGPLHTESSKAVSEARALHQEFVAPKKDDSVAKMTTNVKTLLKELEGIESEFKKVETEFNETLRYERKLGKLASKEKKAEKTSANKDKLEQARMTYKSMFDANMGRMNKANGKFEAMLQSVQTAFWLTQDSYLNLVSEKSEGARMAAKDIAEEVSKFDPVLDEVKVVDVGSKVQSAVDSVPAVPTVTPPSPVPVVDTVTPAPQIAAA